MTQNYRTLPQLSHFVKFPRRISIDCGTVLTKLITVGNTPEKVVRYHVFLTRELDSNLRSLMEDLKDSEEVCITGGKRFHAKSVVGSLVSTKVVLVEEIEAMTKGFKILAENLDESEVLYDVTTDLEEKDIPRIDENNPFIKKILGRMNATFEKIVQVDDEKIKRPSVLMWSGAITKFYLLKEDGEIELKGRTVIAGETFRGLSKSLVDSNDYDTITDLANKGNRANVDTQVKEIFSEDPNSPYGMFPPELPIFSFGKFADHNLNKDDSKIEDLMASCSNMIFSDHLLIASQFCQTYKVKSLYVGGGLFLAPVFKKITQIREILKFSKLKVKMLDCNYVLALGAMSIDG